MGVTGGLPTSVFLERSCENPFSHDWAEKGFSAQRQSPANSCAPIFYLGGHLNPPI